MTPRSLRRQAAQERAREARLRLEAEQAAARAELLERTAERLEALSDSTPGDNVVAVTHAERGIAIARAKGKTPLARAAAKHGTSLRVLARRIGLDSGNMSAAAAGRKSIPRAAAEAIEREVGYAATLANWPGGIRD